MESLGETRCHWFAGHVVRWDPAPSWPFGIDIQSSIRVLNFYL